LITTSTAQATNVTPSTSTDNTANNYGVVTTNYAATANSYGEATTNYAASTPTNSDATVITTSYGTSPTSSDQPTSTNNYGTATTNYGTVTTNYGNNNTITNSNSNNNQHQQGEKLTESTSRQTSTPDDNSLGDIPGLNVNYGIDWNNEYQDQMSKIRELEARNEVRRLITHYRFD